VAQKQELFLQHVGDPFNPILNLGHIFATYRKMAESAGLKNPEQYFPEFNDQQLMQAGQVMKQGKKSPEQQKAEADMMMTNAKTQSEERIAALKMQGDQQIEILKLRGEQQRDANKAELDRRAMEQRFEREAVQAQADIETNNRKVAADIMLAERKFELDRELALINAGLKQQEHEFKMTENTAASVRDQQSHEMKLAANGSGRSEQSNERVYAGLTEAMTQLAQAINAETEIVKDPKTGSLRARKVNGKR
jgi:hypothetical protein